MTEKLRMKPVTRWFTVSTEPAGRQRWFPAAAVSDAVPAGFGAFPSSWRPGPHFLLGLIVLTSPGPLLSYYEWASPPSSVEWEVESAAEMLETGWLFPYFVIRAVRVLTDIDGRRHPGRDHSPPIRHHQADRGPPVDESRPRRG